MNQLNSDDRKQWLASTNKELDQVDESILEFDEFLKNIKELRDLTQANINRIDNNEPTKQ